MDYEGVIIEESLENKDVLGSVNILSTKIEQVTEKHKTPWVKQWTLHTVRVAKEKAGEIAEKVSRALDSKHSWYADYKTKTDHYIIFRDRVFHITDRTSREQYNGAKRYGISLGIPEYQVDFAPDDKVWERYFR